MSSSTPASSAASPASTATTRAQAHPARPGAVKEGAGDLFSSLLALLSATHDAAPLACDGSEDGGDSPGQGQPQGCDAPDHNPLAALLGWPGAAAQTLSTRPGNEAATSAQARAGLSANPLPLAPGGGNGMASGLAPSRSDAPGLPLHGMSTAPGRSQASSHRSPQGEGTPVSLLETPAAPGASTLAALTLARTGTGDATAKPKTPGSEAATRAVAWRSTVGAASTAASTSATSSTTTHTPPNGQAAGTDKMPRAHPVLSAQTRSTVALDERFGAAQDSETPLAATGAAASAGPATGGQPPGSGSGSPGATPETHSPDAAVERHEQAASDTAFADAAREADEVAETHWGTPQLRHASLRVGEAGEDAINIQLAMTGQELNVEFRTDSTEARASLAQDAGKALGDLLERSGIQLGNVSVGAQSQQQGDPGRAPAPTTSLGRGRPDGENEASATPAEPLRPRLDGSRPLDLFV